MLIIEKNKFLIPVFIFFFPEEEYKVKNLVGYWNKCTIQFIKNKNFTELVNSYNETCSADFLKNAVLIIERLKIMDGYILGFYSLMEIDEEDIIVHRF